MFDNLKRLYLNGKIGNAELDRAVVKGWISIEDVKNIEAVEK